MDTKEKARLLKLEKMRLKYAENKEEKKKKSSFTTAKNSCNSIKKENKQQL